MTVTLTATPTLTLEATAMPSAEITATVTPTATVPRAPTPADTVTVATPNATATATVIALPSATTSVTRTATAVVTPTATVLATPTPTAIVTPTATVLATPTATPGAGVTDTPGIAPEPTNTATGTTAPPASSSTPRTTGTADSATAVPTPILSPSARPTDAPATSSPTPVPSRPDARRAWLPVAMRSFAPGAASVFGMQISEDRFRDPAIIRAVRRAGAVWLRSFIFWDEIEPVRTYPPTYDWSLYDPLFRAAADEGLSVIAEIQGNPRWAAEYPGGPPYDFDTLAQFAAAAAERYDGDGDRDAPGHPRVRYWELYNEPDNVDAQLAVEGRGWGFWGHRGGEYARMLKRVHPAIKIASPHARVLLGGVAYEDFAGGTGPFNPEFLDDVLDAGGGAYFDIMNFHYYPLFAPKWARYGVDVAGKTEAVRRKLAQYGLSKPIFATETGSWSSGSPPYPPTSAEEQARYVPQLHARALSAGLAMVCWFQYDDVAGTDDPARGLIDRDLAPKPALEAYRLAARMLSGARPDPPGPQVGVEGELYWFRRGEERLGVAWTNDGSQQVLAVRASGIERTRSLGGAALVATDASDGRLDGVTHVPYGPEPVYLRVIAP